MSETGSVKFHYEQATRTPIAFDRLVALNACRRKLLQRRLIGMGAHGIAFGNLSVRDSAAPAFVITGSGTGGLPSLGVENLARVIAYDFDRNWLRCEGATVASSESLTHAAVYEAEADVSAIIHCHSLALWEKLRAAGPGTPAEIEYGTPAMARAVRHLFHTSDVSAQRLFVMAGHSEGIIAFGRDLEDAFAVLCRAHPSS